MQHDRRGRAIATKRTVVMDRRSRSAVALRTAALEYARFVLSTDVKDSTDAAGICEWVLLARAARAYVGAAPLRRARS